MQKFLKNSSKNERYNWMRKILHAEQSKNKTTKKRTLALHQESSPWKEGIGLISNLGNILSTSTKFRRKWFSSSSFTTDAPRRRRSGSFLVNERTSSEWRSMENMFGSKTRSKKEIPALHWWFKSNCLFPSSSRTFRTQPNSSFIARQCCDSQRILPVHAPYKWEVKSSFYHQLWINIWRSKFEQKTNNVHSALWSCGQKITWILMRLTWMHHVVHITCKMHGRDSRRRILGLHHSFYWEIIDIPSNSIECNHLSRKTSSFFQSRSC